LVFIPPQAISIFLTLERFKRRLLEIFLLPLSAVISDDRSVIRDDWSHSNAQVLTRGRIGVLVGPVVTLGMLGAMAVTKENMDIAGIQDRSFRLARNKGQARLSRVVKLGKAGRSARMCSLCWEAPWGSSHRWPCRSPTPHRLVCCSALVFLYIDLLLDEMNVGSHGGLGSWCLVFFCSFDDIDPYCGTPRWADSSQVQGFLEVLHLARLLALSLMLRCPVPRAAHRDS
jgi:hypothetical protein